MNATAKKRTEELIFIFSLIFSCLILQLFSQTSFAATKIEFPTEELSQETVLPIFDQPTSVKRRLVPLENRFGIGLFGGLGLNDPFYNPYVFGGTIAYHFTNEYGIELLGSSYSKTASQYVNGIKYATNQTTGQPCAAGNCPDFSYAPAVSGVYTLDFKWSPLYGKISLTKTFVMNLITNFYLGVADVSIGDSQAIGGTLGLGQEFFFNTNFGIRADLRGLIYSGPNAVSRGVYKTGNVITSPPPNSAYDQETKLNILFDFGLVFLL